MGGLPAGVDPMVFDFGIDIGPARSAEASRRRLTNHGSATKVCNVIGSVTSAAPLVPPVVPIGERHQGRMQHRRSLGGLWDLFGKGRTRRADAVEAAAPAAAAEG